MREHFLQIARFCTVGLICIVLNFALFAVLVNHLRWDYLVVTVLAFFLANGVGFALSRTWTFRATHSPAAPQLARYALTQALNLPLNMFLMWLLVRVFVVNAVAASLLISILFAIGNFTAQRTWTFRRRFRMQMAHRTPAANR